MSLTTGLINSFIRFFFKSADISLYCSQDMHAVQYCIFRHKQEETKY